MTKLFVGGLTYATTSQDLQAMFEAFGQVMSAVVINDKFTGQSKGFGFVEMQNDEEAQAAIKALDQTEKDGRRLGVSVAKPREDKPRDGGGHSGGGGGGGYNRDRNNSNRGGYDRNRY